jgi:hypothetical protein
MWHRGAVAASHRPAKLNVKKVAYAKQPAGEGELFAV